MMATLVLSGTSSLGTPPSAAKARVWAPIQSASARGQLASASGKLEGPMTAHKICDARGCPARLGVGEIGGAHDGDKNLRRTDLAGEPINDHRHGVAGVIDKQL